VNLRLSLGASLIVIALTAWLSTGLANEEDACRASCQEQRKLCVEECSEHSDPMDCESECDEESEDCQMSCRQ